MMNNVKISLLLSVISITASVIAICVSLESFSLDSTAFLGWTVAVLSMLVVLLMGWNLYTIIDTKKAMKEFDIKIDAYASVLDKSTHRMYANIYGALFEFYGKDKTKRYDCFNCGLLTINYGQAAGEYALCNAMIKALIESFPIAEHITAYQKALLLSYVPVIRNRGVRDMPDFDKLHMLILKISTVN
jgi:hypothetical protein